MYCFCTSIRLSSIQFPWYAAGTQDLLALKHELQINFCLFLLRVLASPLNLFAVPASSVHSNDARVQMPTRPHPPVCLDIKANSAPA